MDLQHHWALRQEALALLWALPALQTVGRKAQRVGSLASEMWPLNLLRRQRGGFPVVFSWSSDPRCPLLGGAQKKVGEINITWYGFSNSENLLGSPDDGVLKAALSYPNLQGGGKQTTGGESIL